MELNDIATWQDWCQSFQDIATFKPLIHEICRQHHLDLDHIENTFPGTNAVFKIGNYIIKIFVPDDLKPWLQDDYSIELKNALSSNKTSNYTPKLYAHGIIKKKFLWKYLVFEYVKSKHIFEVIDQLSHEEKQVVVSQLKDFLSNLNVKPTEPFDNTYIITRVIEGKRWDFLDDKVRKELFEYLKRIDITDSVFVHGDITGDNVLFNQEGIVIIDFGDACIAPYYYEYAPIVLDMFKLDKACIALFYEGDLNDLIELVIKSILIHDFGGHMASNLLEGIKISSFEDLHDALHKEIKRRLS